MKIDVEWQAAPGVRDLALAQTWARLSLTSSAGTPLIEVVAEAGQYRRAVYGSALPLALWFVENYWALLHESPRAPVATPGRALTRMAWLRPWVQRHGLLTAGGGFLLPDLVIARDGDACILRVAADREAAPTASGQKFIADTLERESWHEVREGIHRFVNAVVERLRDVEGVEPDELRRNWSAILGSETTEAALCASLAALGVDPYGDEERVTAATVALDGLRSRCGDALYEQIVRAAPDVRGLTNTAEWLDRAAHSNQLDLTTGQARATSIELGVRSAHAVGAERAVRLRAELGLGTAGVELDEVLPRLGVSPRVVLADDACPSFVRGVTARRRGDTHGVVVGPKLMPTHDRFRLARALYGWHFGTGASLVGDGHDRAQRESRSFAAEFLAPWAGLEQGLARSGVVDVVRAGVVHDLSNTFQVAPKVIEHQVENHGLLLSDDG